MKCLLTWLGLMACVATTAQTNRFTVHDPAMIKQDSVYYLFCTGMGISVWSSTNLKDWKKEPAVFSKPPEWAVKAIPRYRGHTWAPDISYHNGLYYLYYSVSAFGKNTSCIGVATNTTLHAGSPDYRWEDHGKLIQSVPRRDMWNAIDPNLVMDENNTPWLSFGSFWNGIKLVKLNSNLLSIAQPEEWYTIASRTRSTGIPDTAAGDAAIEAPFIFKKDNFYYLFVSFDYCCRGVNSTYKVVTGRSKKVTGPYVDQNGVPMIKSGGSPVVTGDAVNWHGVGHNAVYTFDGKDYIIYHGYDAKDNGCPKLVVHELTWENGWPRVNMNQVAGKSIPQISPL
jgi:Beta-xylosidase